MEQAYKCSKCGLQGIGDCNCKMNKSIYTFRSNEEPNICISFELIKRQSEDIDDSIAIDFMSKLLKIDCEEVNDLFYLDDVVDFD